MRTIVLLILCACVTVEESEPRPGTVLRECGPRPNRPGVSVAFQDIDGQPSAIMSRDTYLVLDTWVREMVDWGECATAH